MLSSTFRRSFYECLHRRTDALFELADAILAADGAVPSPAHLSLQAAASSRLGQPLRRALARDGSTPKSLRELLARHPLAGSRDARLRRRRERLASLRRGMQPRAGILLPSFSPLGGAAHRGRMGLPVRRTTELRARELDRASGRGAPPARPGRQRGRRRAGEVVPTTPPILRRKDRRKSPVRLRCGLRSREAAAGAGGMSLPDPRPFASGAALLRRPEPVRPAGTRRTPSSPRAQDEVQRSRAPGPNPPPSITARTPGTDPCACGRGPRCILRSTTTQEGALGDPCPSW